VKDVLFILMVCSLSVWMNSEAIPSAQIAQTSPVAQQIVPFKPALSIHEALLLADRHIIEKSIDMSAQYLSSIHRYYDHTAKHRGYYWRVQWIRSLPRLGSEYGLHIYMDGTVISEPCGP
jgi:hypothetical protein